MAYDYETEKRKLNTTEAQRDLLATAFHAKALCASGGVARMDALIKPLVGDSWQMLAIVDRLVELDYLREVPQAGHVAGQHRIFRWVGP